MTEENSYCPLSRSNQPWEVVFDTGAVDVVETDHDNICLKDRFQHNLACEYFMRAWSNIKFWDQEPKEFQGATLHPIHCRYPFEHPTCKVELANLSLHGADWLWRVDMHSQVGSITAYAVIRGGTGILYRLIITAPSPAEYTAFLLSVDH